MKRATSMTRRTAPPASMLRKRLLKHINNRKGQARDLRSRVAPREPSRVSASHARPAAVPGVAPAQPRRVHSAAATDVLLGPAPKRRRYSPSLPHARVDATHHAGLTLRICSSSAQPRTSLSLAPAHVAELELLVPSGHPAPGHESTSRIERTCAGRAGPAAALLVFQHVHRALAADEGLGVACLSVARCDSASSRAAGAFELSMVWRSPGNPLHMHLALKQAFARAQRGINAAVGQAPQRTMFIAQRAVGAFARSLGQDR